jgi:mycothiol synthase
MLPEGYRLRHPVAGDMPAAQKVLDAAESADCGEPRRHEQDLTLDSRDPHMDLARNSWVVDSPAGEIVAIAWVWAPLAGGEITADFYVHPEHRRRGLEETCLGLVEARAWDVARTVPAGVEPRLVTWVGEVDGRRREALVDRGFAKTREYYSMIIDLRGPRPEGRLPEGVTVRALRPDDERALYEADREAFAEHHLFEERTFAVWRLHHLEGDDVDYDLIFLAWDADEVAGFVRSTEADDGATIGDLAVRERWRHRGLGRALLLLTFTCLAARGNEVARLFVDAENPTGALRVYERAGMHVERRFDVMEKPLA